MSYTISLREMTGKDDPTIVVVGVGGTGSLVADGLCRLLKGSNLRLLLVDYDRVEEHNLFRQNFYAGDVGKFKAQVLAERLARQYGRPIGYSVFPYEKDMFDVNMGGGMISKGMSMLIIGCVDDAAGRRSIADSITWTNCWLDSGNGRNSGQVLIGNTKNSEELRESFDVESHTVHRLPMPSLQLPALLMAPAKPALARDCAEAIEDDGQSPIINQAMATVVLDFTFKILSGTLTYMAAYINLEAGSLQYVPAMPVTIARMFSMKESELMTNKCGVGMRYHTHAPGRTT